MKNTFQSNSLDSVLGWRLFDKLPPLWWNSLLTNKFSPVHVNQNLSGRETWLFISVKDA